MCGLYVTSYIQELFSSMKRWRNWNQLLTTVICWALLFATGSLLIFSFSLNVTMIKRETAKGYREILYTIFMAYNIGHLI